MVQGGGGQKWGWGKQMKTYLQQPEPRAGYNPLGAGKDSTGVVKWPREDMAEIGDLLISVSSEREDHKTGCCTLGAQMRCGQWAKLFVLILPTLQYDRCRQGNCRSHLYDIAYYCQMHCQTTAASLCNMLYSRRTLHHVACNNSSSAAFANT